MNIDSNTLSDLSSSFTDNKEVDQFLQSLQNPQELQELLQQKTGLDPSHITNFVNTARDQFRQVEPKNVEIM